MLIDNNINKLNWDQPNGLIPTIIQHKISGQILMHAFMNKIALNMTLKNKKVTFFSRKRNTLWTKGETSGNFLQVDSILTDCDQDTLLILVNPIHKTCHLNTYSCFKSTMIPNFTFLYILEQFLNNRKNVKSITKSYTYNLYKSGTKRISQKVGEEAIETIIAANHNNKQEIIEETSDLLYHLIILLQSQNIKINDIIQMLQKRNSF
ncbi:bifunctional phosphoribosyl-AMP cyclohydrolase/phosphoribosyl-ATP diphosphatase HisIE [Enterobacteriaceae endosymbiont of Neohaemonia nigricornis]|uniref:bifunctional phosphoribosyl-AMP cyclohydrolase/phosphoribosyl-ATP diphosphatase HisIE n=1 Tax=Enterobacteriaceae endosymbiont of Neohaemonia nigricornis TaxID=2675792 RepID=UPI00144A024D|nr:bifunctional phosphoribosyl-AMP cyclohydrolase/phosphoribosyl-ATP diphosphatase HisIE [Enterobacteriaceae endosymbiont of Neohaemonia nigricornis]QJC30321.1 bifunctional phosphoribosyl-AMP cyclohydrolase/phosphoribosyl-ATP diphosphatase HisIE [Enterobacteriaceae endosymbiont of Neohaemonia nigricornis]